MSPNDLDRLAASVVMFGFDGTTLPESATALIVRGAAGAILFKRNITTPRATHALTESLRELAGRPVLLSVDQEGGRVARLREGFTQLPPLRRIGETSDSATAERVGRILGRECRAAGFDLNFAPVVDVDSNPNNPVIGDRSFGRDPALSGRLGAALITGLQSQGVAACAKHFPGHGDTHQDSHHALPRLSHDLARLRAVELPPFRAAVAAGVATLMTAHVVFEALDPDQPATLSRATLEPLRRELGFEGVMVSDDLEMAAVADRYDASQAASLALMAGCDLLLVCHRPDRQLAAITALRELAETSTAGRARLAQASARVQALAHRFAAAPGQAFDPSQLRRPDDLDFAASLSMVAGHDPTEVPRT